MTSPLARLTELIAPPVSLRSKDWATAEAAFGIHLPADYKELVDTYGGSYWDGYLYVLEPGCPNDNYDLHDWAEQQTEALEDLWEFEEKPTELTEEGARVLPWATTDNGECLYWLIRPGQEPTGWTVMVNEARGPLWEHFPVTCTQYLVGVLTGEVRSTLLSSSFPLATHTVEPLRPV